MPNALPQPAELRGHLIIARCGEGASRTSPSPRENTRSVAHPLLGWRDSNSEEESGPPIEGRAAERESGLGGNDDASPLLGIFFQLKSWELESINNDLVLCRDTMGK